MADDDPLPPLPTPTAQTAVKQAVATAHDDYGPPRVLLDTIEDGYHLSQRLLIGAMLVKVNNVDRAVGGVKIFHLRLDGSRESQQRDSNDPDGPFIGARQSHRV
eukprot:scaffold14330_cov80-Cyclotella_meneghiniana.AAC.1